MDRDDWHKSMSHFPSICCSSPLNLQVLFYDGHDNHFNDRALDIICIQNIESFIFKSGSSVHEQPKNNGQTLISITCMLMKELTGWDTMEPSSLHRIAWIMSSLKHGKLLNYHPRKSSINISRRYISCPSPHQMLPPTTKLVLMVLNSQIYRKWMRLDVNQIPLLCYIYVRIQDNWPNGHTEG